MPTKAMFLMFGFFLCACPSDFSRISLSSSYAPNSTAKQLTKYVIQISTYDPSWSWEPNRYNSAWQSC